MAGKSWRGLILILCAGHAVGAPAEPRDCPEGVAAGTRCIAGIDEAGAHYWLAVPPDWSGTLVVHAHGGPELGTPKAERPREDLHRWAIWTRLGLAYAGSGFHQAGVAVTSAAEDTERVRKLFVEQIGAPKRTILHGQSWGAGVAARAAELFPNSWNAVLLSSGVLAGGSHSYDFRLDLRVVYEAICANHPGPDEPDYPLWQGLPRESKLTRAELAARVDQCTGVRRKAEERSPEQQQRLKAIVGTIRIPESSLIGHLNWGTWHFQDIAFKRTGGRNPFSNQNVRYTGSGDAPSDAALNAKVRRYTADREAAAMFSADTDPEGRIAAPVLTVHAIDDPTAFVELESAFRETMQRGGSAERLVQAFTAHREHSYLSDATYASAMRALIEWADGGAKPTPAGLAERCGKLEPMFDPAQGCRFRTEYQPPPLAERVPPR
jgi:pimeloyl-ACP methyl ester carboxylesterase